LWVKPPQKIIEPPLQKLQGPRAHKFKLPIKDERNFIPRLLYKGICIKANQAVCMDTVSSCMEQCDRFIYFVVILVASPVSYECLPLNDY